MNLPELRPYQIELIEQISRIKTVLASWPVGYGKTLPVFRLAQDLRVILISPMKALAIQQAQTARKYGLTVAEMHGDIEPLRKSQLLGEFWRSDAGLLICLPESFRYIEQTLAITPDVLITLDEIHLAVTHSDFRPAYGQVLEKLNRWNLHHRLMLTGTASSVTRDSLNPSVCNSIRYELKNRVSLIDSLPETIGRPGFYYTASKAKAYRISDNSRAVLHAIITGETTPANRKKAIDILTQCREPSLIGTTSVAYGIDLDFRYGLIDCPNSIDDMVQLIGRVGRREPGEVQIVADTLPYAMNRITDRFINPDYKILYATLLNRQSFLIDDTIPKSIVHLMYKTGCIDICNAKPYNIAIVNQNGIKRDFYSAMDAHNSDVKMQSNLIRDLMVAYAKHGKCEVSDIIQKATDEYYG